MELFEPYSHALVSLALFALIALAMSGLVGARRSRAGLLPGELPAPDLGDPVYRLCRAYHNTVDNAGTFAAAVAAAVLTGAAPFFVNVFASLGVLARLAFVVLYVRGIGVQDSGPRTVLYVANTAMTVLLALMAVFAGLA